MSEIILTSVKPKYEKQKKTIKNNNNNNKQLPLLEVKKWIQIASDILKAV